MRHVVTIEKNGKTERFAFCSELLANNVSKAFAADPECKVTVTTEEVQ